MSAMAPAVDQSEFRAACGHFATGVCVVTSLGPDGPSGMTANAVSSLSLDPPLMIVCFALTSRTLAAVEHSRRFGVQFLAHDQEDIAARFASKLPEAEKFEGIDWRERAGVPSIDGSLAWLGCELRELYPGGDHRIGVGEVVDLWEVEGDPLVFFRGDYWSLANREDAPPEVDRALEGPG
jgi:3-hydroxy-9,10-secoandrosta-1,3,5(10)-triene-9,17-dione monooxygenase reductase component